jgi:hypothetical protein
MLACASVPDAPAPGRSHALGRLRLVPHEGVPPAGGGEGAYGDRRLRDVEFVDYSKPGFAVVYVEGEEPGGELDLAIRATRLGTRLDPVHGAVGAAGRLVVTNRSGAAHVLSYPAAGVVRAIRPGERLELALPRAGEQGLFLLDVPEAEALVFAAPGPFAVVSSSGRFALRDLPSGTQTLHAWHPRFPPLVQQVDLPSGGVVQVELEMGVGRGEHAHAD